MKKVGSVVGGAFAAMGKAAVAGTTAAVGATVALVKKSVSEYAEYQQLLGGVQKLYGTAGMSVEEYAASVGKSVDEVKDKYAELTTAQDLVLENAQNAYATAGMSTQEYMEQATSFSAALINSLGGDTVKAAEQTDVAMRAISDNYNTFGGDMESISRAYQGFAKQNYTMLDNLKLGYGGTKTEMERLIADANAYAEAMGQTADLSIDSFSDIVTAIDLVQQKQGVAGTTAREAASTISGSLGMLKGAWQNLVAGMADPDADISKLIDNVVTSAKTYVKNIIPTIKQATTGLVQLISEVAPIIAQELPSLLSEILPMLIETGIELFNGLVEALPDMIDILFEQLPMIIESIIDAVIKLLPMVIELGIKFVMALAEGLLEAIPEILPQLVQLVKDIVTMLTEPDTLSSLLNAGLEIIMALADALIENLPTMIPAVIDIIFAIVDKLTEPDTLVMLIEAAVQIALAILEGLINSIPNIISGISDLIGNIFETLIQALPVIAEGALEMFGGLLKGLLSAIPRLLAQIPILITDLLKGLVKGVVKMFEMGVKWVTNIKDGIKSLDPVQWGKDLIQNFIDGLLAKWEDLKNTVKNIAGSIKDFLGFSEPKYGPLSNFSTYAPDMMQLFMQGVKDNEKALQDTIAQAFDFESLITSPTVDVTANGTYNGVEGRVKTDAQEVNNTWNITINQPVKSAAEVAKAIREEAQYGLIGGVNYGGS